MTDPAKVPEAVLEAFWTVVDECTHVSVHDGEYEEALAAALAKYNELLLSDYSLEVVCDRGGFPSHFNREARRLDVSKKLQAAIDSVMKGEGDG